MNQKNLRCNASLFLTLLICHTFWLGQTTPVQAQSESEQTRRLKVLQSKLESDRQRLKIPGLALGVVRDGKVIFAEGFGLRDVDENTPVDAQTVFAIGSATKPFTSTLIAMLVDEGQLDWDDPMSRFTPEFQFSVETDHQKITILDLLTHQTGYGRMSVLSMGDFDRLEVIEHATRGKPQGEFRKSFHYSNIMYTIAGVCAGRAGKSDWDTLVKQRILEPLEMSHSSTSIDELDPQSNVAMGYSWDEEKARHLRAPWVSADSIGPAGSINSNIVDMTNWLRFLLNDGVFNDRKLVSKESLRQTWKPVVKMPDGGSYGLGWSVRDWNGHSLLEHGGNFGGFASQVALLPDERLGFVLLTNVEYSPLQQASIDLVFKTLLHPLAEAESSPKPTITTRESLKRLSGRFVANVGIFEDALIAVATTRDGGLTLTSTDGTLDLYPSDSPGVFTTSDEVIVVSFEGEPNQNATSVSFDVAGKKRQFVRLPEIKPIDNGPNLELLSGSYFHKPWNFTIQVTFRDGYLYAKLNGELHVFAPPTRGSDTWTSVSSPDRFQLAFTKEPETGLGQLLFTQPGPDIALQRITKLPTFDELCQRVKRAYGNVNSAANGIEYLGRVELPDQGARGRITIAVRPLNQYVADFDFGRMARFQFVHDARQTIFRIRGSWHQDFVGPQKSDLAFRYPWMCVDQWRRQFPEFVISPGSEIGGQTTTRLMLFSQGASKPRHTFEIDSDGRILRTRGTPDESNKAEVVEYTDFRQAHGTTFPFRQVFCDSSFGEMKFQLEEVRPVIEWLGDSLPTQEMQEAVHRTRFRIGAPGLVAVVVKGKETWIASAGHRTMRGLVSVSEKDRWHIGSVTKMLTSSLVGRLVDQGKLKWDTTIGEALEGLELEIQPQYRRATLIDFLAHRSGMKLDSNEFSNRMTKLTQQYLKKYGPVGPTPVGFQDGNFAGATRVDRFHWMCAALQEPPAQPLGAPNRIYENGNYIVIAALLEYLFDRSFEDLMQTELFGPLGMTSTGFGPPGTPGETTEPVGHVRDDAGRISMFRIEGPARPDNPPVLNSSGRVHLSAGDMASFMRDQIAGARGEQALMSPAMYARMHKPPFGDDYALGWIARESGGLGHGGTNGKWLAMVEIRPDKNMGVFLATNLGPPERSADELKELLANLFQLMN